MATQGAYTVGYACGRDAAAAPWTLDDVRGTWQRTKEVVGLVDGDLPEFLRGLYDGIDRILFQYRVKVRPAVYTAGEVA